MPKNIGDWNQISDDAKRFASEVGLRRQKGLHELRQREDAQDDVQPVADESKIVEEQVAKTMRTCHRSQSVGGDDDENTSAATSRVDRAMRHAFTVEGVCWKVARATTHSRQ